MTEDNLLHFGVAFVVPFVWAAPPYPPSKKLRFRWMRLRAIVLELSPAALAIKEFFVSGFSAGDVLADVIGLFAGTAILQEKEQYPMQWKFNLGSGYFHPGCGVNICFSMAPLLV